MSVIVTTGAALKIKLPYNQSNEKEEYIRTVSTMTDLLVSMYCAPVPEFSGETTHRHAYVLSILESAVASRVVGCFAKVHL
jgi:hypothetical protein